MQYILFIMFIIIVALIVCITLLIILKKMEAQSIDRELSVAKATEYELRIMALQAQIKPHFLYNSLMAVSAAGMENGNWKVELMCNQLGELFQYAADERYHSTVEMELKNIKTYLDFMKWRYLETLEYSIDIDEKILENRVPRLILQPIVENCFAYAYHSILPPLKTIIRGKLQGEQWFMEVIDNGTGIKEPKMKELKTLMHGVKCTIDQNKTGKNLETNGKALINIYARLYLWYGEKTIFELDNIGEGFRVRIGGSLNREAMIKVNN